MGSVEVLVARHACVAKSRIEAVPRPVKVEVRGPALAAPPVFTAKRPCADCGRCIAICPQGAINRQTKADLKVDKKKCSTCRVCAEVCLTGAMLLEPVRGCVGCGLCLHICPQGAIVPKEGDHV